MGHMLSNPIFKDFPKPVLTNDLLQQKYGQLPKFNPLLDDGSLLLDLNSVIKKEPVDQDSQQR